MARKKKLLPKDFEERLKTGDLADLKQVFDTCDLDARGGVFKQTALAFNDCPDDLSRWLVAQGADLSAGDSYGDSPLNARAGNWRGRIEVLLELGADVNHGEGARGTPLHNAAGCGNRDTASLLLAHGARIDALDSSGLTPLERALQRCTNVKIEKVAEIADLLLGAGARTTPRMKDLVTRIGTEFEFHRARFNRDLLGGVRAGLDRLYTVFDVPPVPRRAVHDGVSPIVATADRWEDQHQQLWELLVPSNGAATTVQGEVIRISGRLGREIDGNGGVNWDAGFRAMARAWLGHVQSGAPLPPADMTDAAAIVTEISGRYGDTRRLCELAVTWVRLNPTPVALPTPSYER